MMTRLLNATVLFFIVAVFMLHPTTDIYAQGNSGISQPSSGDIVSGIVILQGTAVDTSFLRYEIAFKRESGGGGDWTVFAQGDLPVVNGTLAVWDTTVGAPTAPVFPNGFYQLRLRVVRTDYNYDEFYVSGVIVANGDATPTESPTPDSTSQISTPLPSRPTLESTFQPGLNVLPSLTPIPTPSPRATPVNAPFNPSGEGGEPGSDEGQGLFQRFSSIEMEQFGRSFWSGVRIVLLIFLALGLYLIFRALFRRIWRILRTR